MLLWLVLCGISLFLLFGTKLVLEDWQRWTLGGLAVLYNFEVLATAISKFLTSGSPRLVSIRADSGPQSLRQRRINQVSTSLICDCLRSLYMSVGSGGTEVVSIVHASWLFCADSKAVNRSLESRSSGPQMATGTHSLTAITDSMLVQS